MEASDWQVKLIMQMRESLYQMVASDWLVIKGAWPIMQMKGHVTKWWPLIG